MRIFSPKATKSKRNAKEKQREFLYCNIHFYTSQQNNNRKIIDRSVQV